MLRFCKISLSRVPDWLMMWFLIAVVLLQSPGWRIRTDWGNNSPYYLLRASPTAPRNCLLRLPSSPPQTARKQFTYLEEPGSAHNHLDNDNHHGNCSRLPFQLAHTPTTEPHFSGQIRLRRSLCTGDHSKLASLGSDRRSPRGRLRPHNRVSSSLCAST